MSNNLLLNLLNLIKFNFKKLFVLGNNYYTTYYYCQITFVENSTKVRDNQKSMTG